LNKHGRAAPTGKPIFDWNDSDARIKRLGSGKYVPVVGHENMPIVEVSWLGARNYCASISKRLPTEAEREFAARGPEGWLYPWGNSTQIKPARATTKAGVIWHLFMRIQKGQREKVF
jgi:formylglycine-generating enzyme required for sulfatase activity